MPSIPAPVADISFLGSRHDLCIVFPQREVEATDLVAGVLLCD